VEDGWIASRQPTALFYAGKDKRLVPLGRVYAFLSTLASKSIAGVF